MYLCYQYAKYSNSRKFETFKKNILIHYFYLHYLRVKLFSFCFTDTVFKISKYLFFAVYMYPRMLPAPTWIKMVLIKMLLWYYYATIRNQCHTVGKHFPPHTLNGQFRINFIILYKWNQGKNESLNDMHQHQNFEHCNNYITNIKY